jgi:hypothetical protein
VSPDSKAAASGAAGGGGGADDGVKVVPRARPNFSVRCFRIALTAAVRDAGLADVLKRAGTISTG